MAISEEAFVAFLYDVLLGRPDPPPADVAHWASMLRSGQTSMAGLVHTFAATDDGREHIPRSPALAPAVAGSGPGGLTAEDFVRVLFDVLFDRLDADDGVAHWTRVLRDRLQDHREVFRAFVSSPEGRHRIPLSATFGPFFEPPRLQPFATEPELVALAGSPLVVDVGAMAQTFEEDVWRSLADAGWRVVGFEPQDDEREARAGEAGLELLPFAVGDGTPGVFHTNVQTTTSSLYESNLPFLRRVQGLAEHFEVADRTPIETVRLDDVAEVAGCDFLKVDVQGAELDVLRGAEHTLDTVTSVFLELEFAPLYRDQPLFADVDTFMRGHGFELFDLPMINRYHHDDGRSQHGWAPRRLLWAEGIYVATPERLAAMTPARVIAAAWVVHDVAAGYDWCRQTLQELDARAGTAAAAAYERLVDRGFRDVSRAPTRLGA